MLRLAQRSSMLGAGARLLAAPSSVAASQHERNMSSKKAVIFNMGGSLVPAMSPILQRYAREHGMNEADLTSKLFKDGDQGLMEQIEPALLSRHGSEQANLAYIVSAIQSIRGEGLKTALVADAGGLDAQKIPVDQSLFDAVSPSLKPDIFDKLKVDSSDVVYMDNLDKNLKAAQALGMTAIKVEEVESALRSLESELNVPLKEFVPGFTWIFYDNANNPHKKTSENLLYYFLVIYLCMVAGHFTLKKVLKLDGTSQLDHH